MRTETLPGILPTASLVLEVLLGPSSEVVVIFVTVRDPDGRLIAQRAWPGDEKQTTSAVLDVAWRALLNAMPKESFIRNDRQ